MTALITVDTVSMSMRAIAELAGVRRPVVSTWRRRHLDFPAPSSGTESRPLFDGRAVVEWLVTTGRADRRQIEPDLRLYTLADLETRLPVRDLIASLTALLCLHHLDGDPLSAGDLKQRAYDADPADDFLRAEVMAAHTRPLASIVDDLIEAAWGVRQAFVAVMAARQRLGAVDLYAEAIVDPLAHLIAGLSTTEHDADRGSIRVADPYARAGDLLTAVADHLGEAHQPEFRAADPDPYRARLLRRRLIVGGVDPKELDVTIGELGERGGDDNSHAVVTQLPYHPSETRTPSDVLARVDDIYLQLAPGSTAVVLGPADVLAGGFRPFSQAQRIREGLLTSGAVEAIVRLPGGLLPFRPGYETALWVLCRSAENADQVLLADVSDRRLSSRLAAELVEDVVTWRRPGYRAEARSRDHCTVVAVSELIGSHRPLARSRPPTPRQVVEEVPRRVAEVRELEGELFRLAGLDRPAVHSNLQAAVPKAPVTSTIGALIRAGRLRLISGGRPLPSTRLAPSGHHRIVGPPELTGSDRRLSIDRLVLTADDMADRIRLTEPEDVIVTTVPRLIAEVDHAGFSIVETPARVLRVPPAEGQLTPRVLAAYLNIVRAGHRASGAVRARKLREIEVPLLPESLVERLDALLRDIDHRKRIVLAELDALDGLAATALAGLGDGTMTYGEVDKFN